MAGAAKASGPPVQDPEIEALVRKKIYDNLRGLSDEQIDGFVDCNGLTLRTNL